MKRFFVKFVLIGVPFVTLLLVLNLAYTNSYYWTESREVVKFKNVPDNIQLANLGSSLGSASFNYEDFPEYAAFNFALEWQHNIFNYYVLKQYTDKFVPQAVVLIPISYFNITRIEEEYHFRYYTFLDKENIPGWNLKEYLLYKYFPLFSAKDAWKKLITMNNRQTFITKTSHTEEEVLSQSAVYFNWWTGKDPKVEKGDEGFLYNIEAVSRIIDLCYEKDIVPVLVSTPIMDCLNKMYSETDFFDTFYKFTDVLKDTYKGLIYLDYSQCNEFSSDRTLFQDPAHLNIYGAKKFTKQIVQDLKDAGVLD